MEGPQAERGIAKGEEQRGKVKKKSSSGCGCIIILLAVLATMLYFGQEPQPEGPPPQIVPRLTYPIPPVKRPVAVRPTQIAKPTQKVPAPAVGELPTPALEVSTTQLAEDMPLPESLQGAARPEPPATKVTDAVKVAVERLPNYTVLDVTTFLAYWERLKIRLDVTLDDLPTEDVLKSLTKVIYDAKGGNKFDHLVIFYYLPEDIGDDCWAWAEVRDDITVIVYGVEQQCATWLKGQMGKKESVQDNVIGVWFAPNKIAEVMTMFKKGKKVFLHSDFCDAMRRPDVDDEELFIRKDGSHIQYWAKFGLKESEFRPGLSAEDKKILSDNAMSYYVVDEKGDLCYWSGGGFISRYRPLK